MKFETIYFDESGNTGDNLLDKGQPIFALVSHNYNENEISELLLPLESVSGADELHFKSLKKYGKSRKLVLDLLNHPLICNGRIFHYHADKAFMVVIHIVDRLIEPVLYNQGIDIYKGGTNLSTSNMIYILGKSQWNKSLFENVCVNFVNCFRNVNKENFDQFYESVYQLSRDVTANRKDGIEFLNFIMMSRMHLMEIIQSVGKYTLDATISCFVMHCDFWAKKLESPFDVITDDSKQINYWEDMIDFLTKSLPNKEVGFGSRTMKFPLLINSLKCKGSTEVKGIQLADILASAITYAFNKRHSGQMDEFAEEIFKSRLATEVDGNRMSPTEYVTPEELDMLDDSGVNILDFLADNAIDGELKRKRN